MEDHREYANEANQHLETIEKLNTEKDVLSSKLCEQNGIIYNLKDNNANLNDKIVLKNRKIRDLEREIGQKMSDLDELRNIFNF